MAGRGKHRYSGPMILVIGASGQVGRAILRELSGRDVVGTGNTRITGGLVKLDLADAPAVRKLILEIRPAGILVPGGVTTVDWCEKNEALATRISAEGTAAICEAAIQVGAHVVHFSSDYVFSGISGPYSEVSSPDPISAYGRAKLAGERAASVGVILRTSMVYSNDPESKNFYNFIVGNLRAGKPVSTFSDQSGSPTFAPALAAAAVEALDHKLAGLYQVAGPEVLTRLEFALRVARALRLDESLIRPVTSEQFVLPAPRPKKGGLLVDWARQEFRAPLVGLSSALRQMGVASSENGV